MFIVPEDSILKNKWFVYDGERWRCFKTQITNEHINQPKDNEAPPYMKNSYIDKKVWEDFVKSRSTPEFLAKSQKGKENRARNIYPHVLSRGWYDKLEYRMIKEKQNKGN